jgi:DNA-binding NtrC family response regulator
VNCAAISAGLAESELFGHRRGAFTGAQQDRKGLVRAAAGGVLFLDEIGDLDPALQGKLLRVLQERRVLALGHDEETPVDVRVIAATHRDLADLVRRQLFRADLLHRLNVLSVRMPALRERPEDVEPLVRHFMALAAGVPESAAAASRDFVLALRRLELPGNVRQLENVVRRAMVSWRRGDPLRLSDLQPELWLELAQLAGPPQVPDAEPPDEGERESESAPSGGEATALLDAVGVLEACSWKLGRALDLCEQKIVDAALGISSGNRSRAARLLGISPRSIFNKLRKYQI